MSPHERYVRALREAADAYEEANCGKSRPRRHRGPVRVEHGPIDEGTRAIARAQLRRAGLVKVG
jgi:hypothetical protein